MCVNVQHLFVYGTLRRGSNNQFARMLADRAEFVGNVRLQGKLLSLGQHPGAIRSNEPNDWVQGEIHRLEDPQLLALLDDYEGPEFERALAPVQTNEGTIACWIYWYVGVETGLLIASGEWRPKEL
ncbi:MAG: gamma-glutamylcyclotransferase [Bryobacterales bacterium]|nr:gamma-glutamylcyclotransferase [Bryobacterales bacterium]